jgi:RNA polymerase sigma-70 factor, ECF subfamily
MQNERLGPDARNVDEIVLPHLDAAYNLARWLVRNPPDAEDVVQEACLRAVRFARGFREGNARAWMLRIVRNVAYSFLEKKRPSELTEEFNETLHVTEQGDAETDLVRSVESKLVQEALEALPARFREAVILRELEGLSYKEIADVMEIPIGTVMSSLTRGREQLRKLVLASRRKEAQRAVHD